MTTTNTPQLVISRDEITTLISEKGYFKYDRQCKEDGDQSIQKHYNLTSDEVKDIFSDESLKGIRRRVKRVIVFKEDMSDTAKDTEEVVQNETNNNPQLDNTFIEELHNENTDLNEEEEEEEEEEVEETIEDTTETVEEIEEDQTFIVSDFD